MSPRTVLSNARLPGAGRGRAPAPNPMAVHLARARRREEPVTVLVATLPPSRDARRGAPVPLRIVDTFEVRRRGAREELRALLDAPDRRVEPVERRLTAAFGAGVRCGWARFPDDGTTLDVLTERARRAAAERAPVERPAGRGGRG